MDEEFVVDLPEGIADLPDDFQLRPYQHDPLTNTWVLIELEA